MTRYRAVVILDLLIFVQTAGRLGLKTEWLLNKLAHFIDSSLELGKLLSADIQLVVY